MSVKAEVSLQGKYRGTLDILHLLKKESGSETFLFCSRLVSIVFLFHPSTPEQCSAKLTFRLWGAFFKKLRFSECFILIRVISVDGRLIPRKKMLFSKRRLLSQAWIRVDGAKCF